MRCLLGSGGLSTKARAAAWTIELDDFLGPVQRVVFIPYALPDGDRYVEGMQRRGLDAGRTLLGLHRADDPVEVIERAEAVYVGGGNSFRLLARLQDEGLLAPLRARVEAGMPYVGISAGTNMACPTIQTTNDMPITWPRGGPGALGLVPFQINPHYHPGAIHVDVAGELVPYGGETRDDRLREYHEMNRRPILALYEGGWLRIEDGTRTIGGAPARWMTPDDPPRELVAGDPLP